MNLNVLKYVSNQTGEVGSLFPANGVMAMIFSALLLLMVIIQLVLGILNICCCNKRANPNEKQASLCMKLMVIFAVLYCITFVLVIVFTAIVMKDI